MKIRVFSLILALVLTVFCLSACGNDGSEPELEPVEGGEIVLKAKLVDGKIHAEVSVIENPGIAAFNLSLKFDNTKITPSEILSSDLVSADSIYSNLSQDAETVKALTEVTALYTSPSDLEGDGVLFTMVFDLLDGAAGEIEIALEADQGGIVNEEYRDVNFTLKGGKITLE